MKTSHVYTVISIFLMIISLIALFQGADKLGVLIGILMSNIWAVGGQIMAKLGD